MGHWGFGKTFGYRLSYLLEKQQEAQKAWADKMLEEHKAALQQAANQAAQFGEGFIKTSADKDGNMNVENIDFDKMKDVTPEKK